jgi:peptide/nickel transport system permease protein
MSAHSRASLCLKRHLFPMSLPGSVESRPDRSPVSPTPEPGKEVKGSLPAHGSLTQWQLIRRRFYKHHLAGFSFLLLVNLYVLALFAEFFAPYSSAWRNLDFAHCPPQLPSFTFAEGVHTYGVERHIDPITFRDTYRLDPDHIIALRFFPRGEPYVLWGFIEWDRRFFGVDHAAYERRHGPIQPVAGAPADATSEPLDSVIAPQPTFYLFGADKHGHDLFSRIVYGARVSL